ncbi:MAG: phosphatase PAP2 family protein [Gemmatimonadetes bacterium]|nr:phosphatase PAP2 family protein [Gemmatimonadota bacterium]
MACAAYACPGAAGAQAPTWEQLAGGIVVIGSLAGFDESIRDFTIARRGDWGDRLASIGRDYGDWQLTAPVFFGGSALFGLMTGGSEGLGRAGAAVVGVVAGSFANETINQIVGRYRPDQGRGVLAFDPFRGHSSFGSGHAAYSFAIAAAVDEVTDGWLAVPFYGLAGLTALSRVYLDRHWFSDIAFGGLMGYLGGRLGARIASQRLGVARASATEPESRSWLMRIEPVATPSFLGARVRL